ncbi:hypothetical protein, partial [Parvibaculum sp.]|uniref:hypothetical protein n=1 Tax=Parvibaculum sp. TaxID=2024848 RepID=UPI003C78B9D0
IRTRNIHLPMEIMTIADSADRIAAAERRVRDTNSYRAFVDPAKLAELLSCFCPNPWIKLQALFNASRSVSDPRSVEQLKGQLKSIWKRRNQIAHEADINPTLGGIALWPIDRIDAEITIDFIANVGAHLPEVISEPLDEDRN